MKKNKKKSLHQRRKIKKRRRNNTVKGVASCFGFWSVPKNEQDTVNEDFAGATCNRIAVSDGAGGGGVFAELWSKTLIDNLPPLPIQNNIELNDWMDSFADDFYNHCEEMAKEKGGLFLDKFYEEGSYATLSVIWKISPSSCRWIMYGDSTVFCYNFRTKELRSSVQSLSKYDEPPFLLCTISQTEDDGFVSGMFESLDKDSIVFVCSDALSHFLLMLYQLENKDKYLTSITDSFESHTKTSNFIKMASHSGISFECALNKILSSDSEASFANTLYAYEKVGLLGHDDYSFAYFKM